MCIEKVRSPKTFLLKGVGVYNGTKNILVEILAGGMGLKSSAKLNGSLLTLNSLKWSTWHFSLYYPCIIQQTGIENIQTYQVEVVDLIWQKILLN